MELWLILTTLGGGLFAYTLWEPYRLRVVRYTFCSKRLPASFDGLRIVQISDLHTKRIGVREKQLLRIVKGLRADVLVVTGDMVDTPHSAEPVVELLTPMPAELARLVVMGNAEVNYGVVGRLFERLSGRGFHVLINDSTVLCQGGERIWFAGVHDLHYGRADLHRALRNTPPDAFLILLSHSPDVLTEPAVNRADLILCGHTHGGQIRLPFVGAVYTRLKRLDSCYVWGAVPIGEQRALITTCGVGTTRLPMRFLCPPEVVEITLTRNSLNL